MSDTTTTSPPATPPAAAREPIARLSPMPVSNRPETPAPGPDPSAAAPEKSELSKPDKVISEARERLTWLTGKLREEKKAEAAPEPAKDEPEAAKPATVEAPETAKPGKRQRQRQPAPATSDDERAARIAARTAAEAVRPVLQEMAKAAKAAREEPAPPEPEELPDEFAADADIYRELESMFPKEYPGLRKQLRAYARQEEDYQRAWTKDNPGREFDPEDPEHDAFYAANQPKVDKRHFRQAERAVVEQAVAAKVEKRYKPVLEDVQHEKRLREIAPRIAEQQRAVFATLLSSANPEYAQLVDDPEKLNGIAEKDPVANDALLATANRWMPLATEAVKLHAGLPFSDQNPAHVALVQFAMAKEAQIMALPEEDRIDDAGRSFLPRQKFTALPAAEQANHWTLFNEVEGGADYLLELLRAEAAHEVKASMESARQRFERYAKAKDQPANASHGPRSNGGPKAAAPSSVMGFRPAPSARQTAPTVTVAQGGKPEGATNRPGWMAGLGL